MNVFQFNHSNFYVYCKQLVPRKYEAPIYIFIHSLVTCTELYFVFVAGVEVMYEMYNPLLQKIEVLCLEKRLDKELFYLRDCPLEYSYFPQDFEPQMIHEGMEIPVNKIKVNVISYC